MARPSGTQIRIIKNTYGEESSVVANVESLLSVQFTVRYADGTDTLSFQFYSDEHDKWENWK
jgi:hypothetical protein